jgi:hypothetical protein
VGVIMPNRNLLEQASCRSMACMVNAGGAKLLNIANTIRCLILCYTGSLIMEHGFELKRTGAQIQMRGKASSSPCRTENA